MLSGTEAGPVERIRTLPPTSMVLDLAEPLLLIVPMGVEMVVRYMGTKRHMAHHVRNAVLSLPGQGSVADLFSGMGSVAESLYGTSNVVVNDALGFAGGLARARFTGESRTATTGKTLLRLESVFRERRAQLEVKYASRLENENAALDLGQDALLRYMSRTPHAANSAAIRRDARFASVSSTLEHYELTVLYYAAGYFSLRQALELDSLRAAIDLDSAGEDRDWLIGAWIATASALSNAPGHTAQYLKPNSKAAYARVARSWRMSVWNEFASSLSKVAQIGSARWRSGNSVFVGDALDLLQTDHLNSLRAIYADPPYTKDQYSRFYHVYETLYRYDFPDSKGEARSRSDRFSTGFSLKSQVAASFHNLCRSSARVGVPLIISYPETGLLVGGKSAVAEIANAYYSSVRTLEFDAKHSTLGGSKGAQKKAATELLHICR